MKRKLSFSATNIQGGFGVKRRMALPKHSPICKNGGGGGFRGGVVGLFFLPMGLGTIWEMCYNCMLKNWKII